MIHSIDSFIFMIKKYIDKIDIIFCSNKEYQVLKQYFKPLPLTIITNQNKPVIAVNKVKKNDKRIYKNIDGVNVRVTD